MLALALLMTSSTVPTAMAAELSSSMAQLTAEEESAVVVASLASVDEEPGAPLRGIELDSSNRAAPVAGLYDWSKAGYRGGSALPSAADINADIACRITPSELNGDYGVVANDEADDTTGIQGAIDFIKATCSPTARYSKLSRIELPAGTLNVSRQISVDADYLLIKGAGSDPATGSHIVFTPDVNTRYDTVSGGDWDEDAMVWDVDGDGPKLGGRGGWLWPGRGLFRVQSREVHPSYQLDYNSAPANRKDIFEGTVNVHWKAGAELASKPGDTGYAARAGDTTVYLDRSADMSAMKPDGYINIRAANSTKFYEQQAALPTEWELLNQHMRQQMFRIRQVNVTDSTITVDKPLEFDVPVTSVADGSARINGDVYDSVASPIVDPVVGVGFEDLSFTQASSHEASEAEHNYGNIQPDSEMHGIVLKWVANSWVRGVRSDMSGSHPLVTEEAKNISVVDNYFDGSWNKGKGGNGYLRGSRVWDSVYSGNITRNLRHFTFQWSASGNVAIGNSFDSDINLHGGWERNNLIELNNVHVPYGHRSANCASNCGDEGNTVPDDSNWFPIYWTAGKKGVKWSGSTGPRNVFFNNDLAKQLGNDTAPYDPYYEDDQRVFQFGWNGSGFKHPSVGSSPISNWAHNEQQNYNGGNGVDSSLTLQRESIFLQDTTQVAHPVPHPQTEEQLYGGLSDCWIGPAACNSNTVADPINTASGALTESFADLYLPGVGPHLTWTRAYNSGDTSTGPFGQGWAGGYNAAILPQADGTLMVRGAGGSLTRFNGAADNYTPFDPAVTAQLTPHAGGWRLTNSVGAEQDFDSGGRLIRMGDEQNRAITLTHTGTHLASATDALGQALAVTWGTGTLADRVTRASVPDGRYVQYTYKTVAGAPQLDTFRAPDGKITTYTYDTAGRLNGIIDPGGRTSAKTVYDAAGRAVQQTDAAGAVTQLSWDAATTTATITDPTGRVTKDIYTGNVLTRQIDGAGGITEYYYNDNNLLVALITPGREQTRRGYDDRGNLTRLVAPDGTTQTWEYNAQGLVTQHVDGRGNSSTNTYNGARLATSTDQAGHTTSFQYNALGQVTELTDPLNRATNYVYDNAGKLTSTTTPGGKTTALAYDAARRVTATTDPRGAETPVAGDFTIGRTYDAAGRVLTTTDQLGKTTTNTYDSAGRLSYTTDPLGKTTTYTYDAADRVLTVKDRLAKTTTYTYDGAGRPLTIIAPDAAKTTFTYDEAGRKATMVAPLGNVNGVAADTRRKHTTTYAYDADSRLIQVRKVDADKPTQDLVTQYEYNGMGLVTRVIDPLGGSTATQYDNNGNRVHETGPTGIASSWQYDEANNLVLTEAGGSNTSLSYDAAGQLTQTESATGALTTYEYNTDGLLAGTVDPRGNMAAATPSQFRTSYTYDSAGHNLTVTDPLGRTSSTAHTPTGAVASTTDESGKTTTFSHDALGRVASVTTHGNATTAYSYDSEGHVLKVTGPRGYGPSYTYDAVGRMKSMSTNDARTTTLTYDLNGNLKVRLTPAGAATAAAKDGTIEYKYDTLNRITDIDFSDTTPDVGFRYDGGSRVVRQSQSFTTGSLKVEYEYDLAGLPRKVSSTQGGVFTYDWDSNGRLTTRTLPGPRSQSYAYDDDSRVATVGLKVGAGVVRTLGYAYDPAGQTASLERSGGPTSTYEYDSAGQLVDLTHTSGVEELKRYAIGYSPTGNPTQVDTTTDGISTTKLFNYDDDKRITQTCQPATGTTCTSASPSTDYGYDKSGNRTSLTTANQAGAGTTTYAYDHDDRPMTETAAGTATTTYTYNENGELSSKVTPAGTSTYSYGLSGDLMSAVLPDGRAVSYTYDGSGNRITRAVNGTQDAKWDWDRIGTLPVRVSETGTTAHTWWSAPDPVGSATPTADGDTWLLEDPFGNIANTADASGLTGGGDLNPFGDAAGTTSGAYESNPMRFAGQYMDSLTGLYDMRARDYDPAGGRFTGPDPITVLTGQSTQTYHYGWNSPLRYTDPAGTWPEDPIGAVGSGLGDQLGDSVGGVANILTNPDATAAAFESSVQNPWVEQGGFGPELIHETLTKVSPYGIIDDTFNSVVNGWRMGGFDCAAYYATYAGVGAAVGRYLPGKGRDGASGNAPSINSPATNAPTVVFNRSRAPGLAGVFDTAVAGGAPTTLDRVSAADRDINRRAALKGQGSAGNGMSWDEYPFASSKQGGAGATVKSVPNSEQHYQGATLKNFYTKNGVGIGDPYNVRFDD